MVNLNEFENAAAITATERFRVIFLYGPFSIISQCIFIRGGEGLSYKAKIDLIHYPFAINIIIRL